MEFYNCYKIKTQIRKKSILAAIRNKEDSRNSWNKQLIYLIRVMICKINNKFKDNQVNKSLNLNFSKINLFKIKINRKLMN